MSEIITIDLCKNEIPKIEPQAKIQDLKGRSWIRDRIDRIENCFDDQYISICGEMALHQLLFYPEEKAYEIFWKNKTRVVPFGKGDGGQDIIDTNVDIKTSLGRYSQNPSKYKLLVRPQEFKENWIYIQGIVLDSEKTKHRVYLLGWAYSDDIPKKMINVQDRNAEGNTFALLANQLREFPLPESIWNNKNIWLKQYLKNSNDLSLIKAFEELNESISNFL